MGAHSPPKFQAHTVPVEPYAELYFETRAAPLTLRLLKKGTSFRIGTLISPKPSATSSAGGSKVCKEFRKVRPSWTSSSAWNLASSRRHSPPSTTETAPPGRLKK